MFLVLVTLTSSQAYTHKKNSREGTQAYAQYARPSESLAGGLYYSDSQLQQVQGTVRAIVVNSRGLVGAMHHMSMVQYNRILVWKPVL
jgi:hypothetical protein